MIHITLNENKVHIEGHTESTICSSISSIMYTSVNALLGWDEKSITYIDDCFHDYVEITIVRNWGITKFLFENMKKCFKQIAEQYPDCVKITESVQ